MIYNHPTILNTVKRLEVKYDCLEGVKTKEVIKSFSSYEPSHSESKLLEINSPNGRRYWRRAETYLSRLSLEPSLSTIQWVKVKVKWSRYRPGVAQRVGRGIALLFHDCGTRGWWVVSSTPRQHFTPGKDPVAIVQEAGWAPGPFLTGVKSRPHRDSIPNRPARSRYTDWATRPTYSVSNRAICRDEGINQRGLELTTHPRFNIDVQNSRYMSLLSFCACIGTLRSDPYLYLGQMVKNCTVLLCNGIGRFGGSVNRAEANHEEQSWL